VEGDRSHKPEVALSARRVGRRVAHVACMRRGTVNPQAVPDALLDDHDPLVEADLTSAADGVSPVAQTSLIVRPALITRPAQPGVERWASTAAASCRASPRPCIAASGGCRTVRAP
jgi:hypothetical protein